MCSSSSWTAAIDAGASDKIDADFVGRCACTSYRNFLGPVATDALLSQHMSSCLRPWDPIGTLVEYCQWRRLFERSPARFDDAYRRACPRSRLLAAFALVGGAFCDMYTCPVMSHAVLDWSHSNREFAKALVRFHGPDLLETGRELQDDKDVVLTAVRDTGYALAYASERLKHDEDVVECAVCTDGAALAFAPDAFKEDPRIVRMALASDGNFLRRPRFVRTWSRCSWRCALAVRHRLGPDSFRLDPQIRLSLDCGARLMGRRTVSSSSTCALPRWRVKTTRGPSTERSAATRGRVRRAHSTSKIMTEPTPDLAARPEVGPRREEPLQGVQTPGAGRGGRSARRSQS